jgi:hypothetical protein
MAPASQLPDCETLDVSDSEVFDDVTAEALEVSVDASSITVLGR